MTLPMRVRVGDTLRLRKQHPCGGFDWVVVRVGADIGLRCLTCGRKVMLPRAELEKRVKTVVSEGPDIAVSSSGDRPEKGA